MCMKYLMSRYGYPFVTDTCPSSCHDIPLSIPCRPPMFTGMLIKKFSPCPNNMIVR